MPHQDLLLTRPGELGRVEAVDELAVARERRLVASVRHQHVQPPVEVRKVREREVTQGEAGAEEAGVRFDGLFGAASITGTEYVIDGGTSGPDLISAIESGLEPDELPGAISLSQSAFHGSRIMGPAVADWVVARWGTAAAFCPALRSRLRRARKSGRIGC